MALAFPHEDSASDNDGASIGEEAYDVGHSFDKLLVV